MPTEALPDPAYLRQRLDHERVPGKLYWREWLPHGPSWNARWAGREAFATVRPRGYRQGTLDGRKHLTHRVIWAMIHGAWPEDEIDHIDRDPSNNDENLRVVDRSGNSHNVSRSTRNTSGVVGVCWHRNRNCWQALIKSGKTRRFLGHFADFDEAVAARRAAEADMGFHPGHGCPPTR